jgi:hypothetical protein
MLKAPGLALTGAGLGPGAATTAPFEQGPLWHPSPQWAVLFPQYPYILAKNVSWVNGIKLGKTYEQQLPWAQSPQIVLSFVAPHVPSLVTVPVGAVLAEEDTADMTGSPVVLDGAAVSILEEATEDTAADLGRAVVDAALLQPEMHPLADKQWPSVLPQYP